MSILITGASGFLGSSLVKYFLQESGHCFKVIAVFRSKQVPSAPVNFHNFSVQYPSRFQCHVGIDFESEDSLKKMLESHTDIFAVVHLGFLMEFHPKNKEQEERQTRINLNSAQKLIDSVKWYQQQHKNRRVHFIFASSQEAIGPTPATVVADETTPCNPTYLYGKNKRDVELLLINNASDQDSSLLEYTILRICGVTGKGDRYAAFEMIQAAARGFYICYPGSSKGITSFVHVNNVMNAMELCILNKSRSLNQIFIIGPDSSQTYKECIDAVCTSLGRSKPFFVCPTWLFKALVTKLYPLYNVVRNAVDANERHDVSFLFHPDTVENLEENRCFSSDKAKRLLNYTPMSTVDALKLATKEHIEEGAISYSRRSPYLRYGTLIVTVLAIFGAIYAMFL